MHELPQRAKCKGHPGLRAAFHSVGRTQLAQAAEQPDYKDDRQRNANQPQQESTSHICASTGFEYRMMNARFRGWFRLCAGIRGR